MTERTTPLTPAALPSDYRVRADGGLVVLSRYSKAAYDYLGNPLQPAGWHFWDQCPNTDETVAAMLSRHGLG